MRKSSFNTLSVQHRRNTLFNSTGNIAYNCGDYYLIEI